MRCPSRRVQEVVDGGQRQGRSIQHMKQTLVQGLMGGVLRGGLGSQRKVKLLTKSDILGI